MDSGENIELASSFVSVAIMVAPLMIQIVFEDTAQDVFLKYA